MHTAPPHNPAGYYYHYKHDPNGPVNNYAYFIFGAALHSEDDAPEREKWMQSYIPLYESLVYRLGKCLDMRPLAMAMEYVVVDGVSKPRFSRIEDSEVIAQLRTIRNEMYPEIFE